MIVVVLPAYNEAEGIGTLVEHIRTVARKRFLEPVKVIVVDDGSADDTAARVRALEDENTILVQHPQNRGLGEAIKTGLLRALEIAGPDDIIVTMDADNTHTPGLLPRMVSTLEGGNDVVIASRYQPGARVVGLSPWREFLSTGMRWLFQILLPIRGVRDYSCGYRAYRVEILRRAFERWGDDFISQSGFSCMVDILLKLDRLGAVMTEVPLVLHYENKIGKSKMNVVRTIRETLRLAWREKLYRLRHRKLHR